MKKLFLLIFMVLFSTAVLGANNEFISSYEYSRDSTPTSVHEVSVEYKKNGYHKQYMEISTGYLLITEDNKFTDFRFIGTGVRFNFNDYIYTKGHIRLHDGDTWNPVTYGLSLAAQKEEIGLVEIFMEKSIVDSYLGLDREYTSTVYGLTTDYEATKEITMTGTIFTQRFKDDNDKIGKFLQITYSPLWFDGSYVKVRGKWNSSEFDPDEYFAPDDYKRYDILFGYTTSIGNNWKLRTEVGPGVQYVDDHRGSTYEYRIKLNGWITDNIGMELYHNSTTDDEEDRYTYTWSGILIKYIW